MKKKILAMLLALTMATALAACTPAGNQPSSAPSSNPTSNPASPGASSAPFEAVMLADFANGPAADGSVFASDGWSNGSVFNVWWKGDMVTYSDGQLHLGIADANGEVEQGYYGGEARTGLYYGYGDYIVKMKPSKAEGTASTFFTCTGPYDINAEGNPNPWDEIDIEFLGKDTTGVQFNYYVNGQGGHEYWYDLGFDASEEFHEYGFRWSEDAITWYVDGEAVYTVNASADNPLPSTPGRILMNYWCGTPDAEGWMGKYELSDATADYQWVKTSATGRELVPSGDGEQDGSMDGLDVSFANGAAADGSVFASDGWSNGSVFNVWWKGDMVTYSDGQLHLGIADANGEVEQGYYGGEARTGLYYGYGDYIVKMKPSKAEGTASTFFTCTGPYDINAEGNPNPWDEIDIEFLGKDTTGVQFNYFVDGQGGHEYWYDLGFDASEEFHEYGFRWSEDAITWYVDGEAVYTVNASADNPLPSTPGRILMNHWCGTPDAEGWMGKYELSDATADYQWVKTSATGRELVPSEDGEQDGAMDGLDVSFANGAAADGSVFASDGWSNGSVFNVWWKGDMVTYSDGQLHLGISDANGEVEQGYYGGEARTAHHYGYGEYSVSMKPSKAEGTASTFFTCTGNYDIGLDGNPNPWDEIDIEFLGKDTTGVQFNYFVDGQGGHEYWYDLGFDASEEFHEYGFRWAEDSITWTVDGKDVYTVEASEETPLPSTPGRILMNYWCGTPDAEGWMGKYELSDATADYQWIKTTATGVSLGG